MPKSRLRLTGGAWQGVAEMRIMASLLESVKLLEQGCWFGIPCFSNQVGEKVELRLPGIRRVTCLDAI